MLQQHTSLEIICCDWHCCCHEATHHSSFGVISKKGLRMNLSSLGWKKKGPLGHELMNSKVYLEARLRHFTFYIFVQKSVNIWSFTLPFNASLATTLKNVAATFVTGFPPRSRKERLQKICNQPQKIQVTKTELLSPPNSSHPPTLSLWRCTSNSFAQSVTLHSKEWLHPFSCWKGAWVLESLSVEICQKHSAELLGPKEYNTPWLTGFTPRTQTLHIEINFRNPTPWLTP